MSDKCLYPHRNTTGILSVLLLFFIAGCAGVPVVKMPTPLPDIVKEYKTFTVYGGQPWHVSQRHTGKRR